jgi:6-phosphogluconolactonase (cycloisomerase 2 family)
MTTTMDYRLLVASYGDEIITLNFNPESRTLSTIASLPVGSRPSWITPHTSDPSIYFASLELEEGEIVVLKYNESGIGQVIGKIPSLGVDPCHSLMTEGDLLIANVSFGFGLVA